MLFCRIKGVLSAHKGTFRIARNSSQSLQNKNILLTILHCHTLSYRNNEAWVYWLPGFLHSASHSCHGNWNGWEVVYYFLISVFVFSIFVMENITIFPTYIPLVCTMENTKPCKYSEGVCCIYSLDMSGHVINYLAEFRILPKVFGIFILMLC